MATRIQVRRDLKANWSSSLVLASGEVAYETDTGNVKIGDNATQWSSLDYVAIANLSSAQTDANHSEYRKQGRFYLNTPSGSWTNLPSDMTAADGESVLLVTRHMESSTAWFLQQLTQFVTSGSATKSWVRVYDSGAASYSAWKSTAHLVNNEVTDAMLRDSAALSVIGRSTNSSGDPADIAASSDGEVLRRSGTSLGFGTIANAAFAVNTIGLDKLADMTSAGFLGRSAAGAVTQVSSSTAKTILSYGNMADETKTNYLCRSINQVGAINLMYGNLSSSLAVYPRGSSSVTNSSPHNPTATLSSITAQSLAGAFEISSGDLRPTSATGGTWFVITVTQDNIPGTWIGIAVRTA